MSYCGSTIQLANGAFLDNQVTSRGWLKKTHSVFESPFLSETIKKDVAKSFSIILSVVLSLLFSYASAQQNQSEGKGAEFYVNQGVPRRDKSLYDQPLSDYKNALDINPGFAEAYYNRGRVYYLKGDYDKSSEEIKKAQDLGYKIPPKFLVELRGILEKMGHK